MTESFPRQQARTRRFTLGLPRSFQISPAWDRVAGIGADRMWQIRHMLRSRLVAEARRRLRASWRQRGVSESELGWIREALDDNVLTIGFARRVPSYKRLTLMLHDPDRLTALALR